MRLLKFKKIYDWYSNYVNRLRHNYHNTKNKAEKLIKEIDSVEFERLILSHISIMNCNLNIEITKLHDIKIIMDQLENKYNNLVTIK
jgi:hypothetical protein